MNNKTIRFSILLFFLLLLQTPSTLLAVELGQPLIPFKGMDMKGQPFDLQKSIGTKPVLIVFWASWCPTCKSEVPKVNQLVEKYQARGMDFVAVNIGANDSIERARAFVQKTGIKYPVFFDSAQTLAQQYTLQGVPTVIIADKRGIIRFRHFMVPSISEEQFAYLIADSPE
jgi:thiol-disulfide isomerase/thioredoxin